MIKQLPELKRSLDICSVSWLVTHSASLLRALPGDPFPRYQQVRCQYAD